MRIGFQVDMDAATGWNALEKEAVLAVKRGVRLLQRDTEVFAASKIVDPSIFDMVGIFGVKNQALLHRCEDKRVPFLYFDKAYSRKKGWWKISVNHHHPTQFLMKLDFPDDRRRVERWELAPWRPNPEGHILIAGSSLKYHNLYWLPDPTTYWTEVVSQIRRFTQAKIIYRPKKSWHEAVPIEGTVMSTKDNIVDELRGARCMITHGSNSCFEALVMGIPAIVLGEGVTAPISSRTIDDIPYPFLAHSAYREKILNSLAYFQWSVPEISQGLFWSTIDDCIQLQKEL